MQGPAAMETGFQSSLLPGLHTEGGREREIRERKQKRPNGRRNPSVCPLDTQPPPSSSLLCHPGPDGAAGWTQFLPSELCSFLTIPALLDAPRGVKPLVPSLLQSIGPSAGLDPLCSASQDGKMLFFFFLSPVGPTILTPSEAQEALADDAVP